MIHEWQILDELVPAMPPADTKTYIAKGIIGRKTLCVIKKDDKWYALDGKCPHAGGPLFAGKVSEGAILCPWHRFAFDLNTGQSDSGGYYVNAYPIKEEKGKLWVKIPKRRRWWF